MPARALLGEIAFSLANRVKDIGVYDRIMAIGYYNAVIALQTNSADLSTRAILAKALEQHRTFARRKSAAAAQTKGSLALTETVSRCTVFGRVSEEHFRDVLGDLLAFLKLTHGDTAWIGSIKGIEYHLKAKLWPLTTEPNTAGRKSSIPPVCPEKYFKWLDT
jgi:hypothetical protein